MDAEVTDNAEKVNIPSKFQERIKILKKNTKGLISLVFFFLLKSISTQTIFRITLSPSLVIHNSNNFYHMTVLVLTSCASAIRRKTSKRFSDFSDKKKAQ